MIGTADTLRRSGLDTLPEEAVIRLVGRFTGELRRAETDTVVSADAIYGTVADMSVTGLQSRGQVFGCGTASEATFRLVIERWRRAREVYSDVGASAVFGEGSSPAEGVNVVATEDDHTAGQEPLSGDSSFPDSVVTATPAGYAAVGGDPIVGTLSLAEHDVLPSRGDSLTMAVAEVSEVRAGADTAAWSGVMLNVLVVGVTLGYMFCIYRYFDDVVALFRSVFRRSVRLSDRMTERRSSEIFYGSLGKLFLLGVAFVGVLAMGWAMRCGGAEIGTDTFFYTPLTAAGAFFAVVVMQYVMLAGVGFVTQSLQSVSTLLRIRLIYFVLATVMVAPLLLIAQMNAGNAPNLWFIAGCVSAAVAGILFLRESVMFFISKKVPILHWFLYLCTVEILPLSLLWQAFIRLRQ